MTTLPPWRSEYPEGTARVDVPKAIRYIGYHVLALLGLTCLTWSAFFWSAALGALTLSLGMSVGVHRLLIHRSFRTYKWFEHVLVTLGTVTGLGGPLAMSRMHHRRDYHQNQPSAPPFYGYRGTFPQIMAYALLYRFDSVPTLQPLYPKTWEDVASDRYYQLLDRVAVWIQLPVAALWYLAMGWPGVIWGVGVRCALTLDGFWFIHYLSHTTGRKDFALPGMAEEGRNLGWLSLSSFGESWHNNHHAYPESARMGLTNKQLDPGYWMIVALKACRLAWDIQSPATLPLRASAVRLATAPELPEPAAP
jgi:stearoyl-CoA desaturase (Delta-9 desaturase)